MSTVAFYFSDVNLPYDKFLFTTSQASLTAKEQLSAPGTGWVSLTTILAFKRMQKFQGLGLNRVADALRTYKKEFLKVSEDNTKVGRQGHIIPPQSEDILNRSVYVKGFPKEEEWAEKPGTLQEAIEAWAKQFGDINVVRMRREGGNDAKSKNKPFKVCNSAEALVRRGCPMHSMLNAIFLLRGRDPSLSSSKMRKMQRSLWKRTPSPRLKACPSQWKSCSSWSSLSYVHKGDAWLTLRSRRSAYTEMKAKEKGIPTANDFKDQQKGPKKFNAFREMKTGAKQKKKEEDANREYTITYEGKELGVTSDGKLKDPSAVEFRRNTVLRFSNVDADNFNFKNLKVSAPFAISERQRQSGIAC